MLGKIVACTVTDSLEASEQVTLLSVVFPEIFVIAFWTGPSTELSSVMQYSGSFQPLGEAEFPFEFAYRAWDYAMAGEMLQTHRTVIGQIISDYACDPDRGSGSWDEAQIVSWVDDKERFGVRLDSGNVLVYEGEGYDACVLRIDPDLTLLTEGAPVLVPTEVVAAAERYMLACERLQWTRRPLDSIMKEVLKANPKISVHQTAPA